MAQLPSGVPFKNADTGAMNNTLEHSVSGDFFNPWMFESSPDCIKLLDLQGRLLTMNQNGLCAMEIENFSKLHLIPWTSLWPSESQHAIESALLAAQSGSQSRLSAYCPTAKGTDKWWEITVTPVRDSQGAVAQILAVSRDITALHLAEEEQRETVARLQFMLTAAQMGEWELDLASGQAVTSVRHDQCFGYSEAVAHWHFETLLQHIHADDKQTVKDAFERAVMERDTWQFECRVVWPDRSIHWVNALSNIYRSSGGRPSRMVGTIFDITQRKRAEAVAEGQRKALEMVVSDAPLAAVLDVLTRAAEEGSGETLMATVMLIDQDAAHLHLASAPSIPPAFAAAASCVPVGPTSGACGTAAYFRRPVLVKDMEHDPLCASFAEFAITQGLRSCWSQPILSAQGKLLGTLALYRDQLWEPNASEQQLMALLLNTTSLILDRHQEAMERRRAEQSLRELADALEESNQRKTEFLATLAHELRNPLAPIVSGLEVLNLAGDHPDTVLKVRQMMHRQALHMTHLIDDLLDIARINSGKLQLRKTQFALQDAIATGVEASLPLIKSNLHQFKPSLPEQPLLIEADATRIAQVVSNLLSNAAKYTPKGGLISLDVQRTGDWAMLSVMDNGVGLDAPSLATAFDMFSQVEQNLEHNQSGLGIGLTLVRRLVDLHSGRVEAASGGEGQGCTFTVWLPLNTQSALST